MPLTGSRIVHAALGDKLAAWGDLGLPDTCTIKRDDRDVEGAIHATTLTFTPPGARTIYNGPCRVQPAPMGDARDKTTGDAVVAARRYYASIEHDADPIAPADVLTVTVSEDDDLIGRPMVVVDVQYDTFRSRRLLVLEDRPLAVENLDVPAS